jgi:hypothetical protein
MGIVDPATMKPYVLARALPKGAGEIAAEDPLYRQAMLDVATERMTAEADAARPTMIGPETVPRLPERPSFGPVMSRRQFVQQHFPDVVNQRLVPRGTNQRVEQAYAEYVAREQMGRSRAADTWASDVDAMLRRENLITRRDELRARRTQPPSAREALTEGAAAAARAANPKDPMGAYGAFQAAGRAPAKPASPAAVLSDNAAQAAMQAHPEDPGAAYAQFKGQGRAPSEAKVLPDKDIGEALFGIDVGGARVPGMIDQAREDPILGFAKMARWFQERRQAMTGDQREKVAQLVDRMRPTPETLQQAYEQGYFEDPQVVQELLTEDEAGKLGAKRFLRGPSEQAVQKAYVRALKLILTPQQQRQIVEEAERRGTKGRRDGGTEGG